MRLHPILFLVCGIFLQVGCGGGSGTDSDTGGRGRVNSAPDRGAPQYDGLRDYAELTEFEAVRQVGMIYMFVLNADATRISPVTFSVDEDTEVNETVAGPAGGSAIVKGFFKADGTSWYTMEYDDWRYRDNAEDTVFNGKILVEVVATGPGAHVYVSYYDFETKARNAPPVVLNGYIDRYRIDNALKFTAHLSVEQEATLLLDGVSVVWPDSMAGIIPNPAMLNVEGSLYLSNYGRVDLSMETVESSGLYSCNASKRQLREAQFAENKRMRIHPLDPAHRVLGVQLDLDGDGRFEKARRVTLEEVVTGVNPMAEQAPLDLYVTAGAGRAPGISGVMNIESGLFSDAGSGQFLTYDWRLLQRPSIFPADELIDADLPAPSLVAHRFQDRVLEVTVSDGQHEARDYATVYQSCESFGYLESELPRLGNLPNAKPGENIWLDGRNLGNFPWVYSSFGPLDLWRLTPPAGSTAALVDRTALVTSFIPDIEGTYGIEAQRRIPSGSSDGEWIYVGEIHVGTDVEVTSVSDGWLPDVASHGSAVDLDGDGDTDFVSTNGGTVGSTSLTISLANDDGYGPELREAFLEIDSYGTLVALNIDGGNDQELAYVRLPDVDLLSIDIAADGASFMPAVSTIHDVTASASCGSSLAEGVSSGDVNHDGFDDLVIHDRCTGEYLLLFSDGNALQPPVPLVASIAGKPGLRDVNGDGNIDLAVLGGTHGGDMFLSVQEGNGDGTFTDEYLVGPFAGCCSNVHLAQLDDDLPLELTAENSGAVVGYDILPDHSTAEIVRWDDMDISGWADINGDGRDDLLGCSDRGPAFSITEEGGSWSVAIVMMNEICGFTADPLIHFGGRTVVRGEQAAYFVH